MFLKQVGHCSAKSKTSILVTSALAGNHSFLSNGRNHLENMTFVQDCRIIKAKTNQFSQVYCAIARFLFSITRISGCNSQSHRRQLGVKRSALTTQCVYISRARKPWFLRGRANPNRICLILGSFPTSSPQLFPLKKILQITWYSDLSV